MKTIKSRNKVTFSFTALTHLILICIPILLVWLAFPMSLHAADKGNSSIVTKKAAEKKYKAGEIIVKYKPKASAKSKTKLYKRHGSKRIKSFSNFRMEHVKLRKGLTVEEAITQYQNDPDVEYAEPNYIVNTIATVPNDPFFYELWGLANAGQTGGTPGADIQATDGWDFNTGNNSLVVAVIDTGIDYNHVDIAGNLWVNRLEIAGNGIDDDLNGYVDDIYGIDAYNHDSDPIDDHGHGTHCSGTIGAVGNNGVGIAGVNWDVQVLACKFLSSGGSGPIDGAIECLNYIKDLKDSGENIVATSNSWGCTGCYSQALADAIEVQRQSGILFVAAAGNSYCDNDDSNTSSVYPSSYEHSNIISVAATDHNDEKAVFSCYGQTTVDIGAPGVDIVSLRAAGTDMYGDGNHFIPSGDPNAEYYKASGTSMATPHVAGLAALVQSQDLQRDWADIRNLILAGGNDTPSMNGISLTGKKISAVGSLNCVNSPIVSVLKYPKNPSDYTVGLPTSLAALSINCESPVGPVTATTSGGVTINLTDDGISPDESAGDGIFAGTWIPTAPVDSLTFSSQAGNVTVNVPSYPDLIMTALSGVAAAETGQKFRISNTVRNQGDASTRIFGVGLYLSTDSTITTDDTLIGSRFVNNLAPGAENKQTYTNATIPVGISSGSYYLGAIADYQNAVNEVVAEDNNSFTGSPIVISEVYADLAMTAVSGPANAAPEQQISVAHTMRNQGDGGAWQPFQITLYLSLDSTITTDDIFLGSPAWFASAPAGYESNFSNLVTIPASIVDGTYYLGAIVDRLGLVLNELDPSNNALAGNQITISNLKPDLVATAVSASISVDQLTVTATVQNQGQLNAGATTLGVYLSSDAVITPSDYLIGTQDTVALEIGASTTTTTTYTVLATVPNGNYYVGVIADYDDTQFEMDDTNNSLAGNQITLDLPPLAQLPDLLISSLSGPTTTNRYSNIVIPVSLTNQGPVHSTGSRTRIYISNDPVWSADDTEKDDFGEYGLGAGNTMTRTNYVWISEPPGTYYIIAVADADGTVNEGDENNNTNSYLLVVQ